LKRAILHLIGEAGHTYVRAVNRRQYRTQAFVEVNERPAEYRFALEGLSEIAPTTVLDVGTGTSPWPALLRVCGYAVTATDQMTSYWGRGGVFNRHYHIVPDDITDPSELVGPYDCITCISVLEHIKDHAGAMRSMASLLSKDGHIILTIPFSSEGYVENAYALSESSYGQNANYVCQVFSESELAGWLKDSGLVVRRQEFVQAFTGQYWSCGSRVSPLRSVAENEPYHLTMLLLQRGGDR